MSEQESEDSVVEQLRAELDSFATERGLALATKCQVFLGVTAGRTDGRLRWLCQSAQQDLVFYSKKEGLQPIRLEESELLRRSRGSFPHQEIAFPLVIFEVKFREVITHTLRQYSEEARLVRWAHPFCQYNLLLIGFPGQRTDADKVYMSAKSFGAVLAYRRWPDDRQAILDDIKRLVQDHLGLLRSNSFYRVNDLV
jgi:hypothetical protein